MAKWIKNNSGGDKTWVGQLITNGSYYEIQDIEENAWRSNSQLLTDIGNSIAIVAKDNSGSNDITDVNLAINYLKGILPNPIGLQGSSGTQIGSIGDELKVCANFNNGAMDAFGRLRNSEINVIFEAAFSHDKNDLLFSEKVVGASTIVYDSTKREVKLSVTNSGDRAIRQSRSYSHYIPGQSMIVLQTGRFSTGEANLKQRLGYFDDNNGLFFEYDNATLKVVVRSDLTGSVVDTAVTQSNWNGDKLDGTGNSGYNIDVTKQQIWFIDFQWLGAGQIRFGVDIGGQLVYCHTIYNVNIREGSYMTTASLPVRQEILTTGTISGTKTLYSTCLMVAVEGNETSATTQHAVDTDGTVGITTSSYNPILAIRLKSGHRGTFLLPKEIVKLATSQDDVIIRAIYNPSVTGGTWVDVGTNSIAEYNKTMTSFSGGEQIQVGLIAKSGGDVSTIKDSFIRIAHDIDDVADIFLITAKSLTSSANLAVGVVFEEYI
jgi:hypothetical protein